MNDDRDGAARIVLDQAVLRRWPLPMPAPHDDKNGRGRILVIAGSREMPGAVILAARAALRAGAGKLTIATGASVAQLVALAIPESRVIGLPESAAGGITAPAVKLLGPLAGHFDAVLVGPGMQDEKQTCSFILALLQRVGELPLILDACAMGVVRRQLQAVDPRQQTPPRYVTRFRSPVLLTPHAGEMAHLSASGKDEVLADPCAAARAAAHRWNALVALKGATTCIAAPDGRLWTHEGGNAGLATSGSGDVLAGLIAGLAARGAALEQAAAWGVTLHALAGEQLARRLGPLGFMASELAAEVPALMHGLASG